MDILYFIDLGAAFAVAVLCGMGVGGGGLLVIYLTLCRSVPQLEAQGINLVFFIASASASMIVNRRRVSELKKAAVIGSFGAIGSLLGSRLAHSVDVSAVRCSFGVLLLVGAALVFFGGKSSNKNSASP
ncbi:MAG: sulfite exporter TauE/SafE family protein [Clostridia bacterium]|nr:sulfite exporter TauE/SafE family protein [Clostridia bacterium]